MKRTVAALILLSSSTVFAEPERTMVLTPGDYFNPHIYLQNPDLGTSYELNGGTIVGPTIILPGPGRERGFSVPFPQSSGQAPRDDWGFRNEMMDAIDRDLQEFGRMLQE